MVSDTDFISHLRFPSISLQALNGLRDPGVCYSRRHTRLNWHKFVLMLVVYRIDCCNRTM